MNPFKLLVLLLIAEFQLFSQNTNTLTTKKLDSLQIVIKTTNYDTARFTSWNLAGNIYRDFNVDSAIYCHTKAMDVAIKLKSELKRGKALFGIARAYYAKRDGEKALSIFNEVLLIVNKEIKAHAKNTYEFKESRKLKGDALLQIGILYKNLGNADKANENLYQSLNTYIDNKDTLCIIRCYGTTGMVWDEVSNYEKALKDLKEGVRFCKLINETKLFLPVLLGNLGLIYLKKNEQTTAMDYFMEAYKLDSLASNTSGMTRHLSNISGIYRIKGNYAKALQMLFSALKVNEESKDLKAQGQALGGIAYIYDMQMQFDKAISFYLKAIDKFKEVNNLKGLSNNYLNAGSAYMKQGSEALTKNNKILSEEKYTKALSYYYKADTMYQQMGDMASRRMVFVNTSIIYQKRGDMKRAIDNTTQALIIDTEIGNKGGIAILSGNLGAYYMEMKNYSLAEKYLLKSLNVSQEIGATNEIMVAHQNLYSMYDNMLKPNLAYKHYKLYITYRDSLQSVENTRASVEQELKFNFEKKTTADSIKVAADKQIVNTQLKQEKVQRYSLYGGLLLVALFAVFMVNRFRISNKQKKIIEFQKEIVEEKHKEITDSINYAERIQRSFLATEEILTQNLQEHFVFFTPKDVVSGDFYWADKLNNGNFALVIADSTGHGVPGAIMSLLNITSLEKAIEQTSNPAEILSLTRQTIINRLKKDGSAEGGKDGMDCSLLSINFKKLKLEIAAANNPVWIVRNNELIEIKPDKIPVGKHDRDQEPFTLHSLDLQKGDIIYALTDGFPDQFGGPKGKKFMSKNLKELLVTNSHLPLHEQHLQLEATFANWVGNMEQVDDVTLVGVKV